MQGFLEDCQGYVAPCEKRSEIAIATKIFVQTCWNASRAMGSFTCLKTLTLHGGGAKSDGRDGLYSGGHQYTFGRVEDDVLLQT